jgi:hypothetical protein
LKTNPIVHLADAVSAVAKWRTPIRINDTTGLYFSRLPELSALADAHWYRDILSSDPKKVEAADEYLSTRSQGMPSCSALPSRRTS